MGYTYERMQCNSQAEAEFGKIINECYITYDNTYMYEWYKHSIGRSFFTFISDRIKQVNMNCHVVDDVAVSTKTKR